MDSFSTIAWTDYSRQNRFVNGRIVRAAIPESSFTVLVQGSADHIVRCYMDPINLEKLTGEGEKPGEVFARFLPTKAHIQSGDYGEILCSVAIAARDRPLKFPLYRWRLKQAPNSPVQGVDLVGYRMANDEPSADDLLVICEVKTRATRKNTAIALDALNGIRRDYATRLSEQLLYQDRHLREQNLIFDADRIARFRYPHRYTFSFRKRLVAGLVHESRLWSDEYFDELPEEVTSEEGIEWEISLMCVGNLRRLFVDLRAAAIVAASRYEAP